MSEPRPGRSIGEHGIIGNLDTAALVAADATIDFLCWPHLDSPSIFASLLDAEQGGEFTLTPDLPGARTLQLYLPRTNVLLTRWLSEAGSAEVTDLMPHPEAAGSVQHCLIRRLRGTRGDIRFRLSCRPRFDYARLVPATLEDAGSVIFRGGAQGDMRLAGCVELQAGTGEASAEFTLRAGEELYFVLLPAELERPTREDAASSLAHTVAAWERWARKSTYAGHWREQVMRSALALKLLTSHRHGSIAAAATFGLPEAAGAGRNWDYRASWIRDSSFTVYAFMRLGYIEEAERFRHWVSGLVRTAREEGNVLRTMYALDGGLVPEEKELEHLAGYCGSRPVRIGNAARDQLQLDVYGELLDSVYLANKYGTGMSRQAWENARATMEFLTTHWRQPDAGIWEVRSAPREFLHSRVMCWVALDRAVRLAHKRSLPAPIALWTEVRNEIAEDIWQNFRHPEHGYFVQSRGGTDLDAALLMMPLVRFVSATDPVWLKTLDAIHAELSDDGMIFRYRSDDGLPATEGAFTACGFWFVECLARAGRLQEALLCMEKTIRHANPLGLFSEELNLLGEPLGNFPQALTHLAFISAAFELDRRLNRPTESVWQP